MNQMYKKLKSKRKRLFDPYRETERETQNVRLAINDLLDDNKTHGASLSTTNLKCLSEPMHNAIIDLANNKKLTGLQVAYWESMRLIRHKLDVHRVAKGGVITITLSSFPRYFFGLHAVGWHSEANWYVEQLWKLFPSTFKGLGFLKDRPENLFWFATYWGLGSRELIEPWAVNEPDDPHSVYSILLERWDDPDPEVVGNALLAYSEHNVANMLLRQGQRTGDYDDPTMLFYPYDLAAINMRRKSMGLPWVDNGDERMNDLFDQWEVQPFVKDNIVWPIYLQVCQDLGIPPYEPEYFVEREVDPNTLMVL